MSFEITTLQYGEFKDVVKHKDFEGLIHDLYNINEVLTTYEVLSIKRNGRPVSIIKCLTCGSEFPFSPEKKDVQPKECLKCRIKGATKKRR